MRSGRRKHSDGRRFEARVRVLIDRLVDAGFARDIEMPASFVDRAGVKRKIDIAFTLATDLLDLRIIVECKARKRAIALADIDQIRTLRLSLPERNIFWLVSSSPISPHARRALHDAGMSFYEFADLKERVERVTRVGKQYAHEMKQLREDMSVFDHAWVGGAFIEMTRGLFIRDRLLREAVRSLLHSREYADIAVALSAREMAVEAERRAECRTRSQHALRMRRICTQVNSDGGYCAGCGCRHRSFRVITSLTGKRCISCRICGRTLDVEKTEGT